MSTNPPNRPGIVFAVGARLEAQDYLQKWYTSRIEKIDYEQGKMLIHFERWSHRYDEWIYWDSHRLRPLEGHLVRKETLKDDEEIIDFKNGDEVLARWTDCRYYPAKIEDINKEGTYTVQFYDGVIRSLKRIHIKSMPEDAKGQDWLALVKAATAAAAATKNKPVTKHRVNKEKEERKMGRGSHFRKDRRMSDVKVKDEAEKKQEPVSVAISGNSEPLTFEPKQTSGQGESSGTRKRKASTVCSFQAKRARLNKITGLLASKAVSGDGSELLEDTIGSHPVPDQLLPSDTTDQLKTEASSGDSYPLNQKSDPLSSSPTVFKLRARKTKPENPSWNIKASNSSAIPTVPQGKEFHNVQFPQTLPQPPPSDIPQTGSDVCQLPLGASSSHEFSDLVPLDLSQNSRLKISTSVSSLQFPENQHTLKPLSKIMTDVPMASSSAPASKLPALQPEKCDDISLKPSQVSKKMRSSASLSIEETDTHPTPSVKEKNTESMHEKIVRKCVDRDRNAEVGVKSERKMKYEEKSILPGTKESKEKKDKEHIELKQKNKKKKKKKSKYELTDCEGFKDISMESLERCSSLITKQGSSFTLRCGSVVKPAYVSKSHLSSGSLLELSTDHASRCGSLSDDEVFDGSSTESALMSEDYGQDLDNSSNQEESQEEDNSNAIVRCVCEMDEENGFMIQCEKCLCWQHSICVGLLEDNIPDQYICYICQNPPGRRWSAKYCYDKEWLKNGHMYGLSFLNENYSKQNAKKIVSTHQLLADVYSVTEVLHGLQLKINILQSRKHPDLHLLAQSCIKSTQDQTAGKKIKECTDSPKQPEKVCHNQNCKGRSKLSQKIEGTYITNEHSYQKPQSFSQEQKTTIDQSSEDEETCRSDDQRSLFKRTEWHIVQKADDSSEQADTDFKETAMISNNGSCDRMVEDEDMNQQFPWQMNLLTHIKAVQNEVNTRMDLIEKELDVLESWLDFSGELEPLEPLARLPQLKRHIKQLLTDLGKVQQMASCCSV
ncbi:PHD finger protein 20-like protein 1 isoform X4 [Narcine bancroftii]|uniref:PHD finger protein 20-like protein 1 isoform X4 n=1 Tax=Narcine bancroftii TaxID=1343680 RepID=UPI003831BEFC